MSLKVLFTGLAVSTLALAQMGAPGSSGLGGTSGSPGRGDSVGASDIGAGATPRPRKETKSDQIVSRLKLNKDQMTEYTSILEATAKESLRVVNQWLRARNLLATAMINGKSQTDLDPLVKAMSDAQLQMVTVELNAFQKIYALLKPNQAANAPEAFDLMAGIFEPQLGDLDSGSRGGNPSVAGTGMPAASNMLDSIAASLNLNKDQKKALRTILADGAKEAAPLRDRMRKSRLAAGEAVGGKKSDGEIRQLVKTSAELSTQLMQVELKAFAGIGATLDDTQKADKQGMGRVLILMNNIYGNKNWNGD